MVDALTLFKETLHNKFFLQTHAILFLNKRDLFAKKIKEVPITDCPAFADFEQYEDGKTIHSDPHNYDQAIDYIRHKFESLTNPERKQIYTHVTCAMDRSNIEHVFSAVKHIVISDNILREGLC